MNVSKLQLPLHNLGSDSGTKVAQNTLAVKMGKAGGYLDVETESADSKREENLRFTMSNKGALAICRVNVIKQNKIFP